MCVKKRRPRSNVRSAPPGLDFKLAQIGAFEYNDAIDI